MMPVRLYVSSQCSRLVFMSLVYDKVFSLERWIFFKGDFVGSLIQNINSSGTSGMSGETFLFLLFAKSNAKFYILQLFCYLNRLFHGLCLNMPSIYVCRCNSLDN